MEFYIAPIARYLGDAAAVMSNDVKAAQESQVKLDDMNVQLGKAIVAGKKQGQEEQPIEKAPSEKGPVRAMPKP